jgi:hypothetical protein
MKNTFEFPNIDTSYWKTDDSAWLAQRKADWPRIEAMLEGKKEGKGKTAIKNYFLKGKLPDWEKFADWDNWSRHVDIFILLWLHPSWDESLLTRLRNQYIESDLILIRDLEAGFGNLLSTGVVMACADPAAYNKDDYKYFLHTDGHNELLFRILMGDLDRTEYQIQRSVYYGSKPVFKIPQGKLESLISMGRWLCIKEMMYFNTDMLYQYDLPLEWWYRGCNRDKDYFTRSSLQQRQKPSIEKALWRIHNFDDEKEGDTPRSTFVHKIRKMFDERPFIQDLADMWQKVKEGNVEVVDPWDRGCK